jgi:hypothetical protein
VLWYVGTDIFVKSVASDINMDYSIGARGRDGYKSATSSPPPRFLEESKKENLQNINT